MNNLSKTDMANVALRKARKSRISDISSTDDDLAKDSRIFMKYAYQTLISSYPWPFNTDRMELPREDGDPVRSYKYFYTIPSDVSMMWDIYYSPNQYRHYGPIWDYGFYYFFSFETASDGQFFDGVGELIGQRVASNYNQLWILYSQKDEVPVEKWSPHFAQAMIQMMTVLYEEGTTSDPELLRIKMANAKQQENKAKTLSSIQNRKAYQPVRANLLDTIDFYTRY